MAKCHAAFFMPKTQQGPEAGGKERSTAKKTGGRGEIHMIQESWGIVF
jgi:hypothetical protein